MEIDYEKAYKTVLETATQWIKDGCTDNEKICLKCVFPELRESEDEQIRKELIAILKKSYNSGITLNNKKDLDRYLAYLEKQKDASKAIEAVDRIDKYIDRHLANAHDMDDSNPYKKYYRGWDDALGKMAGILQDVYSIEKQKESLHIQETCKENADSFTDEDERIRKWLVDYFKAVERCWIHWDISPERIVSYLEKQKEPENVSATTMAPSCWEVEQKEQKPPIAGNDFGWIDELKHDLEHPEELDQKVDDVLKQRKGIRALEWSEEDERKRQACISTINEVIDYERERWEDYNPGKPYRPIMKYDEQIDWLKSLRPPLKDREMKLKILKYLSTRCSSLEFEEVEDYLNNLRPSWKPSEEQMEALDKALYCVPEEIGIPIAEIYGHFNKMKKKPI